jgi:hypothetical protein
MLTVLAVIHHECVARGLAKALELYSSSAGGGSALVVLRSTEKFAVEF